MPLLIQKGQKDLGLQSFWKIPNGAPGVENRLSLIVHKGEQQTEGGGRFIPRARHGELLR